MSIPKTGEARFVVTHHEDGRMRLTLDGKPIPGVVGAQVVQDGHDRSILQLSIIGLAFRMETSPLRAGEAEQAG
jgi:hypothetical protein